MGDGELRGVEMDEDAVVSRCARTRGRFHPICPRPSPPFPPASPMPPSPSDAGYSAPHTASASKKTAAGTCTRTPARTPAAYAHQCTRMQSQTRGRMRASEPSRKHRASARLLTTPAIVFIPRPQPPPLATPHTTQVWPRHHPRPRPHDAALWIRDPHTTRPACP